MSLQAISPASCLNPGAELWIVPERRSSRLVQRIDWYLNFQIAKATKHRPRSLPPEIEDILEKCDLPKMDWSQSAIDCLLIPSSHVFPNHWVLIIRDSDQWSDWVQSIATQWTQMKKPSLRVFLPTGKGLSDFEKAWGKNDTLDSISVVVD